MDMCPYCCLKTPRERYYLLLGRTDELIAKQERLRADAEMAGDVQTVWFCDQMLNRQREARNNIACPEGVA